MLKNDLKQFINQVPELTDEFAPVQKEAIEALQKYGEWLEKELLPKANRDFRIGTEKFEKKLYYSLNSDLSKEDILSRAEKALIETQDKRTVIDVIGSEIVVDVVVAHIPLGISIYVVLIRVLNGDAVIAEISDEVAV